ncbi:MAG: hypothetical protein HYY17_00050, partial [Planctomycetes bacterium]|nr:hypothetical protein [Planctomycetota bacterium]
PPPDPPERQKIAVEAAGRIYDVLFEIGCGRFKQFFLMGQKMPKEMDVRYAFDDPKIYEDLVKSPGGPELVRKFAKVVDSAARYISQELKEEWVRFGLLMKKKGKDMSVNLDVQKGDITAATVGGEVPVI